MIRPTRNQTVHLFEDSIHELASALATYRAWRVFLVLDEAAYRATGAATHLDRVLGGCEVTHFIGFEPNPKLEDVLRGITAFRESRADLVVAFGGGTAIDLAKLINGFAVQPLGPREMILGGHPLDAPCGPLVAIPTTAGTGSEATHFAVVYVDGKKYSVAHPMLRPNDVIFDPKLTHSLPPAITATTGLDAFCQAIESIWAVGATEESIGYATRAAELAIRHLHAAIHSPTSEARRRMCEASHLAGRAIDISKTTLPHALSYAITSRHGIPHGEAVAMTLSSAFRFNSGIESGDCLDPRGVEHVRTRLGLIQNLFGVDNTEDAVTKLAEFIRDCGRFVSPEDAGIGTPSQLEQIARGVNADRLSNNPRRATPSDLLALVGPGPST